MADILADLGYVALGSRLKRLAERLQTDAAAIMARAGLPTQPSHFPLLTALDRHQALTVTEVADILGTSQPAVTRTFTSLVELGLVTTDVDPADKRVKRMRLTAAGASVVARMKTLVWPSVDLAVREMAAGPPTDLLGQIARIEDALARESLVSRTRAPLALVEWDDALAERFYTINAEWIRQMFALEATDEDVLRHPRERIIDRGGTILFVEAEGLGIVGTCALMPIAPGVVELTKMGVLESARGRKAGEFLLAAALDRARIMAPRSLFLLTSRKCEAAIHLYEKVGFVHDADVMAKHGRKYARCDVAMSFPLAAKGKARR
ncbi:bifunctional helix-turn-helix transcriptional regulator/GNAT family N-acetyltransferase [Sandaracinus amylolyticus]|uniref:bifunctional helix-turn-helix transcriptional regulator/GNAT family N-acetyltransferase n=1 Tax=Sandaracinus amylolyticus TaxID=927083 RepID=UPI001F21D176|nr:bifunctional helix-turn-helix transcriptional regulator/GNAT family N-acetyltransferase [Sandaracinus amylolyticus]UJR79387.1 Transcriptional regulator MarR [Sandaracinus amylolyticus]